MKNFAMATLEGSDLHPLAPLGTLALSMTHLTLGWAWQVPIVR